MDTSDIRSKCNRLACVATYNARQSSEVLWVGENVIVFRTGRQPHRGCVTYLFDKIGLTMDDKENISPLEHLATLSHPAQKEQINAPLILHTTHPKKNGVFSGRWCKSMQQRVLAFAREKDRNYDGEFSDKADAYDARERWKKEERRRAHAVYANLVVAAKHVARKYFGQCSVDVYRRARKPMLGFPNGVDCNVSAGDSMKDPTAVLRVKGVPIRHLEFILEVLAAIKPEENNGGKR